MSFSKVTIIGSGNLAWHLVRLLKKDLVQVYSRQGKAHGLGRSIQVVQDMNELEVHNGLFILAVPDDYISEVTKSLPKGILAKGTILHCSGATPATVLKKAKRHGVFWPVQTLTKGRRISYKDLPIMITASNPNLEKRLRRYANGLGCAGKIVSDKDRLKYHCAAVLVNNFSNHLFSSTEDFLKKEKLDFSVMHSILGETSRKAIDPGPGLSQTGPAKRGDAKTILRHLKMLEKYPDLFSIYQDFTAGIFGKYLNEE
ncbi:MAG: DUF2520 domain-containing protein [Saprospiraceae bacterium]|nr:DUF2520 domain-containing protein [Saprospiraceae bacterium]